MARTDRASDPGKVLRDLGVVGVGVVAGAAGIALYRHFESAAEADQKPTRFRRLDPRQIGTDAATFQFKDNGDAQGVTDRLKGVKKWDSVASGKAVVYERADGKLFIADGHQRLGLAKRLSAEGQKVKLDAYVLREKDGWTTQDARAYAALKNIKESSGNAIDMAKVMRARPDLVNGSVPMSDAKVKDAAALAKLSDPAFDLVAKGVVKPEVGVAIAGIKDKSLHEGLVGEMAKADLSREGARLYVSQAAAAGVHEQTTMSLFGEEMQRRSLLADRAKVLEKALGSLKSDKRLFGLLEREAGRVEGAGNVLAHDVNKAKAEGAGSMAELVERLSLNRGPVSDLLEAAARGVANGESPAKAARAFVESVQAAHKNGGLSALTGDAPKSDAPVHDPNQMGMFEMAKPKSSDGQGAMFGEATTKDKIAAEIRAKEAKGRVGDPATEGLFSSSHQQIDLVDAVKASVAEPAPAASKAAAEVKSGTSQPRLTNAEIAEKGKASQPVSAERMAQLERRVQRLDTAEMNRVARGDEAGYEKAKRLRGVAEDRQLVAVASKGYAAPAVASGENPGWSDAARAKSAEVRAETAAAKPAKALIADVKAGKSAPAAPADGTGSPAPAQPKPFDVKTATLDEIRAEIAATKQARSDAMMSDDRYFAKGRDPHGERIADLQSALHDRSVGIDAASRERAIKRYTELHGYAPNDRASTSTILDGIKDAEARQGKPIADRAPKPAITDKVKTEPQAGAPKAPAAVSGAAKPLDKMSMADLKKMAAEHGVAPSRSKQMLVQRIKDAQAKGDGNHLRGTQNAANLNAIVENKQANAKPLSPMEQVAKTKTFHDVPKVAEAVKHPGTPIPAKPDTASRGLDIGAMVNEALAKHQAKPSPAEAYEAKFGHAPPDGMSEGAMQRWTDGPMKVGPGRTGDPAYENVVRRESIKAHSALAEKYGAKPVVSPTPAPIGPNKPASGQLTMPANPVAKALAPKAGQSRLAKATHIGLAALGPVAIGASAAQAAGEVRAQGGSTSDMLKAGGKAAAGTTAGIGGFMLGQAAAVKGLVKAGLGVAKAVPLVNAGLMVGGAAYGAWEHRHEGGMAMLKGAGMGAWNMSLIGMGVNTLKGVYDAGQAWHQPAGSQTSFAAAAERFQAMRSAAGETDSGEKKKGWSNAARVGAYKARMAKRGQNAANMPYGGAVEPPKTAKE